MATSAFHGFGLISQVVNNISGGYKLAFMADVLCNSAGRLNAHSQQLAANATLPHSCRIWNYFIFDALQLLNTNQNS